jgi:amino acid adenylation domain-containing protein
MSDRPLCRTAIPFGSWTTTQREFWSLHMLEANGAALNTGRCNELVGDLDLEAFVRASRQTVEDCEALRIRFSENDGQPFQWIAPIAEWSPVVLDLSHEADPLGAARDWIAAERARTLDITKAVFSWTLIKVAEAHHIWCLNVHHLAGDGFTNHLITCRMADNYSRLIGDVEATSNAPGLLSDLMKEDAAYRRSEDFKNDRIYWLDQMADLQPPTRLTSRASNGSYMSVGCTEQMPASASAAIRMIMAETGVSLGGLFVCLTALYLRRLTSASDIVVGLLVAARTTPAMRNAPGAVSNTVPIRLKINADTTRNDLIAQVRERIREALTHQRLPLSELKAGLPSLKTELYAIALNVQKSDFAPKFGALVTTTYSLAPGPVDDLEIRVYEQSRDGGFEIAINGNANRYEVAQLAEHYKFLISCLEQVCRANPTTPVDAIHWILEADRALLVDNDCGAAPDTQRSENPKESDGADKPNSTLEVQVCSAFARAFGVESFSARANFFEEGGYSLLAARLISALARELQVKIPLRALFENPTPRALTRYLSAPVADTAENSDLPMLVLFPNGGALMREMIDLSNALRADFSVLFIEYPNSRQDWNVICDVDSYLDFILAQIKTMAPEPRSLTLLGYSFGASVAYAMYIVLSRLGYTVERLNTIDGRSPIDAAAAGRALRLASHVVTASSKADVISRVSASAARALGRFLGAHAKKPVIKAILRSLGPVIPDNQTSELLFHVAAVLKTAIPMRAIRNWTTAISYPYRLVAAPVMLFRSIDDGDKWSYDLGWTELAPKLEIVPLHSSHKTIVNEGNIAVISSRIRAGSKKPAAAVEPCSRLLAASTDAPQCGPALRGRVNRELLRDELLSEIFAATVARMPDAVCMTTQNDRLTYAEVDTRAAAIARGLMQRGVKAGEVVGLWLERGVDLLISQIAIVKTGATWLPFDSETPVQRVAACLSDAGACLLLADAERVRRGAGISCCPVVNSARIADPADVSRVDARALGATPDHAAYVIYTSGSTGEPKGIVVSNRNICHFLRSVNEVYGLTNEDVMFQNASAAFDLSLEQIWLPYLVGASLFVADIRTIYEIDELPHRLERAGVTVLDTLPTLLAILPRDVQTLRMIILGGESCPSAIVEQWAREGRALYNTYGPTEATVVATAALLRQGENVTIGRPIPNYSCYVVDADLVPVCAGVEGELLIGGPGVVSGYLGRSDLTARKFIANPFRSDGSDSILYRTGDAVEITDDRRIVFKGRIDDQVKIRGFRVELGEIDARLSEISGISIAATILLNEQGDDLLVSYVVTDTEINAAHLRKRLREYLPGYMVPMRFECVESLPRLPSGKVDRKALAKLGLKPRFVQYARASN